MTNFKMNNETEFVFEGFNDFTIIPNCICDIEMTSNALGLYVKIVRRRNIQGWKVYQCTLEDSKNKRTTVSNGINELIKVGLIKKEQLRNEQGHIKGIKYTVFSKPTFVNADDKPVHTESSFTAYGNTEIGETTTKNKDIKNKDIKNIYSSSENEQQASKKEKEIEINNSVEEIWKAYPFKKGKAKSVDKIKKLLKTNSKEKILNSITEYKKFVASEINRGFQLNYQNGSTFFNSGIYDYLDINIADSEVCCTTTEPKKVELSPQALKAKQLAERLAKRNNA